jgi:hypothetical protein
MRESLYSSDDVIFDRLVDGELSASERQRLLESLDSLPEGWRRCAIAFLEAQSWGDDLRHLVRQPVQTIDTNKTPPAARTRSDRTSMRPAATWFAVAASLLIGFSLALMLRNDRVPIANVSVDPPRNEQFAENVPPPSAQKPNAADGNDAMTLWVRDESGQPQRLRVPLLDASTLDRELGVEFQSGLPADVRSRLQDRGYDVESKRRYAPIWLENGHRMIVPVEDTKIVPVSENVY